MSQPSIPQQAALEVAAFLDSRESQLVSGLRRDDLRRLTETFVELCYGALGKAPRLLDADDVRELLTQLLPARLAAKDPLALHVPDLLAAFFDHLEATHLVSQSFELRRALNQNNAAFFEAVQSGRYANSLPQKRAEPFVHGASKLGRNDPCSCGSGKKFKKCHGKDA